MNEFSDSLEWLTATIRKNRPQWIKIALEEGLSPEDALECVQDALCGELTRDPGNVINEEHAHARLRVTVRNAARNARRLHHRAKNHVQWDANAHQPNHTDVETIVSQAEDFVRLNACVAKLCEIQQSVVMLRLLEERSGQNVAKEIGVSRNHVDVLLSRAKNSLRNCMST